MRQLILTGVIASTIISIMSFSAKATDFDEDKVPPYLTEESRPDAVRVLRPPPQPGSLAYENDRKIFLGTRSLEGTPYWDLAVKDIAIDVQSLASAYQCATGADLTLSKAPKLRMLLARSIQDAYLAMIKAKKESKRARPFQIDQGAVCEGKEHLTSFDYPSGHSTFGWTTGLILAELFPEHSTDILIRARTYAESRVVCGAHNQSAVDAGQTVAASIVATLHSSAEFRGDMDAAKIELADIKEKSATNSCDIETGVIASQRATLVNLPQ